MSKGSKRRPMKVNQEIYSDNYDKIFKKKTIDVFDNMMIDKILTKEIEKTVPDKEIAVLLSGGVDSISVAFAAERLGKKIISYSFRLDNHESYDYNKAKDIAQMRNWRFITISANFNLIIRYRF